MRAERRQLEVLAVLVARLGVLVARLLQVADDEVRVGEARVGDQRQVRQIQGLVDLVRGQRGLGAVGQIAGRVRRRRARAAAPRGASRLARRR